MILWQIIVWIFILVNTTIIALLIVVGPKAMAQAVYDLSQSLKRLPYGWLILVSVIGMLSASFIAKMYADST